MKGYLGLRLMAVGFAMAVLGVAASVILDDRRLLVVFVVGWGFGLTGWVLHALRIFRPRRG
jgi:hypothetical protein